jgi:SpoVK/Ycf46/Vps4 family AAA+-type ATPase
MFKEAEAEGALLFLDEADTFLRDRSMARAEWSVSTVNEMLQGAERFGGVFIAATNLFQDIDAAALRRFTFKLEFLPLKPEQAWKMFCNETGFDETRSSKGEIADLKRRLADIPDLTPGDMATCQRMNSLLMEDEPMTTDDWIEQLAQESKAKMHGLRRNKLGFGNSE